MLCGMAARRQGLPNRNCAVRTALRGPPPPPPAAEVINMC